MTPTFRGFRFAELPAAEMPGRRSVQKPIGDALDIVTGDPGEWE